MDQLKQALALHLLRTGSRWLDPRQFETVVTWLMLFSNDEPLAEANRGIDQGHYTLDSGLLSHFYDACPEHLKLELFLTSAVYQAEPALFERLLRDTWRISSLSPAQRTRIAFQLGSFLRRNPVNAEDHRDIILEALRSPRPSLCVPALSLVSYLNDVELKDLARIRKKLSDAVPELRMNALNGLCEWTKRHREVSPRVLAFCTSPELYQRARQIFRTDPDKDVRTCAYFFLRTLGAYRRASGSRTKRAT